MRKFSIFYVPICNPYFFHWIWIPFIVFESNLGTWIPFKLHVMTLNIFIWMKFEAFEIFDGRFLIGDFLEPRFTWGQWQWFEPPTQTSQAFENHLDPIAVWSIHNKTHCKLWRTHTIVLIDIFGMHKHNKIETMQNNMTMANKKLQEFYFIQHWNLSWLTNAPPNLLSNCNELANFLATLCFPYMHGRSNNFLKWPTFVPLNNGNIFYSRSSSIIMLCNIVQQIMNS